MKNWHQTINSVATILTIVTGVLALLDFKKEASEMEQQLKNDIDSVVTVFNHREEALLLELKEVKAQKALDSAEYHRLSKTTENKIKKLQDEIEPLKERFSSINDNLPDL